MVVLLAIAGSVAAVLFSRAQDATSELENTAIGVSHYAARSEAQCDRVGGDWTTGAATGLDLAELRSITDNATITGWDPSGQPVPPANATGVSFCKP